MTDKQLATTYVNILVTAVIFTYLLMLGFGNFDSDTGFMQLLPFGFLLSYWKSFKNV